MSQSPFAKKPAVSSTKVLAPPGGGAQTFNLFGGDEPVQQQRSSIGVNPTGNATSIHSPFSKDPQAAPTPERRSSITANPNSNNFKSDVNSPFSKEPLPRKGRQNSMVNVPSQDSPFNAQTSAPEQTGSTWTPKANVPSDDNPFNSAPPPAPSTPQRPFTANKPSEHNPFTTSSDAPLPATVPPPREFRANQVSDSNPFNESNSSVPQQNLSIKPQASPGGKSNINLFAPPPEVVVSNKLTPTYGYTQDSPFNKDPQASPNGTIKRRESRVNVPSTENPFFNSEPVQQSVSSYQPKANVPSDNSPFSNSPMPQLKNDRDAANRPSADNPFNQSSGNTNASGQQRGPSTRVLQTPGGNQSFNVFSHNQ